MAAAGRTFDDPGLLPERKVALVLGTSRTLPGNRVNLYFSHRMDAAAELFRRGKVKHLLVSGSNPTEHYNEPDCMRKALIERGVPSSAITLDYAGFRTLDSIVRCKEVFSQQDIVIVSQRFHNERALFIARHKGLDAIAFNANDVPGLYRVKMRVREALARCRVLLDLYVFHVQPKFLGDKVHVSV